MELTERHERATAEFDRQIREVGRDRWSDPTPCSDWDVRTLVDHVVVEQLWAPHLLDGARLDDVGDRYDGDQLGDDPVVAWERASEGARAAVTREAALEDSVHTSAGRIPASSYVAQLSLDLAVHAWDLGRAIGGDERLDEELVDVLLTDVHSSASELAASGLFAPPRPTAPTADAQTRLLALLGRAR